jgi:hypothetical protein
MLRHAWTILCSQSIHDADTGNLTIVSITTSGNLSLIEEAIRLVAEDQPIPIPLELEAVTLWALENPSEDTFTASMHVLSPKGHASQPFEYPIEFDSAGEHFKRIKIPFIPFDGFGRYYFVIRSRSSTQLEWQEVDKVPLDLKPADPEDLEDTEGL